MKDKFKLGTKCAKGEHDFLVSKWFVKGTQKNAIEYSCRYCLIIADKTEQQEQSKALHEALKTEEA